MILAKKPFLAVLLPLATGVLTLTSARAEFLFDSFIVPASSLQTDRSTWDIFYTPYGSPNYPDFRAPFGTKQTASDAGVTPPANANPSNPSAFWDTRNPTITQTAQPGAFIVSPGTAGNIYSFSGPTAYRLNSSTAYDLGTVAFQFQTDGTLLDFNSIRLQYTNTTGNTVTLAPNELLREYRASGSTFGGTTNRSAMQWNLTGLGIHNYQILYNAAGSSNSFQIATLATGATYGDIVPASRTWTANGTAGAWNTGGNWAQGTSSNENGNVRFANSAAASIDLDASHTVGEVRFDTAANTTIDSSGGFALTSNTGVTTTAAATGNYTINAAYHLGAFNLFDIQGGGVTVNSVVSGAYGLEKDGPGTLVLANNNTFTGSLSVGGGALRLTGSNTYSGGTSVQQGSLVVAAENALGSGAAGVSLGADSSLFTLPAGTSAALVIDGNHTVDRGVALANGGYEKRLAVMNTTGTGAIFSGAVDFGTADNVKLTATAATDRVVFSGAMSSGANTATVTVDGAGTVVFSGANKSYGNATNISAGMLQIASGTTFNGTGAMSVNNGASLRVDGTLAGGGALAISSGVLTGGGMVSRVFSIGAGATVSPGNGVGTLSTVGETWAGGGSYRWELNSTAVGGSGTNPGQDLLAINGGLSLSATAGNRFTLRLSTLTAAGEAGLLAGFDPAGNYAWRLASTTTGVTGFDPSAFLVDTSGFANGAGGIFSLSVIGNDLYVNYAAVPEPSTWVLVGLGMLAGLLRWYRIHVSVQTSHRKHHLFRAG